jgi:pimeloyl-ACP methyl ester carboxylesterase
MESRKVEIGNMQMSFYDIGEGKPIVLIHGFAGSKLYWERVISQLSEKNRVIAIDLPGHGESTMAAEKYSIEDMAEQIKDLLDQLGLEKVTMFGHSLGGYITLAFAELYPDYLNGFSLVHSTANPDSDEAKAARETNAKKVAEEGIEEFVDGLSKKLFSPANSEVNAEDIKSTVEIGVSTSIKGVVSALIAMRDRADRNNVLENFNLPVLLIAGEDDQIIPPEKTFSVSKFNIEQIVIKGSGHMSMHEQPLKLIEAMQRFLDNIK